MKRNDLLLHLADAQYNGSAPITLSIGSVINGTVRKDTVVIKDASPTIFGLITRLVANGALTLHNVHITPKGLTIFVEQ